MPPIFFNREAARRRSSRRFMPEIQALRAIAVGLVVAFHLYPTKWFASGFVGVDVFFVISGYLITSHLLKEMDRTGTVRLTNFYARRIRRLLPASLMVLAISFVASAMLLPERFQLATAREIVASTFYVENLWLAKKAITYSASNDTASAVQHYWSLSTEEQFYMIWPALILLGLWAARHWLRGHTIKTVALLLVVVMVVSLAFCTWHTWTDQSAAYFFTPTRVWEFAIGGLTSFFLRVWAPDRIGALVLRWGGLAAILAGGMLLGQVAFPGLWALLPTVGAAAVIIAGDTGSRDPLSWVSNLRFVQWIGDISYAVYLWHWPFIALLPFVLGPLHWYHKAGILAVTLFLSHFTRKWVEVPGQTHPWLQTSNRKTFVVTVIAMALIAGSALAYVPARKWYQDRTLERLAGELGQDPCVGAGAAANRELCGTDPYSAPPGYEVSETDAPWGIADCDGDPRVCWSGERPAKVLALVGDSHAESMYHAVKALADEAGWGVVLFFEGGCPATYGDSDSFYNQPRPSQQCKDFAHRVTNQLRELQPDMVVTTAFTGSGFVSEANAIEGFHALWREWTEFTTVTVLRDYPWTTGMNMPDCLASHPGNQMGCATDKTTAMRTDLQYEAALTADDPRVKAIDLSDLFCDDQRCYPVIGGLPVYYDHDHITRTFSKSLAQPLREPLGLD